jgi:predicted RNase H-like HicB family nuclease
MKTFTVRAQRSGKWWALDVPEVPGVFSQVRRLDQAEAMARDAIAAMLEVDSDSFAIEIAPDFAPDVKDLLDSVYRARQALDEAQRAAAAVVQHAAAVLTRKDGLSMRDAGRALGISHQRVAQILEENARLGHELGNFGGGELGGVAMPKGDPMGPHGAYEGPVGTKAG